MLEPLQVNAGHERELTNRQLLRALAIRFAILYNGSKFIISCLKQDFDLFLAVNFSMNAELFFSGELLKAISQLDNFI